LADFFDLDENGTELFDINSSDLQFSNSGFNFWEEDLNNEYEDELPLTSLQFEDTD
jgi:hypothetical protein